MNNNIQKNVAPSPPAYMNDMELQGKTSPQMLDINAKLKGELFPLQLQGEQMTEVSIKIETETKAPEKRLKSSESSSGHALRPARDEAVNMFVPAAATVDVP